MIPYHVTRENLRLVCQSVSERLCKSEFCVAVTGAGISRASGLPLGTEKVDGVPLNEFFRSTFFDNNPMRFYEVYRETIHVWRRAVPNVAHQALAQNGVWVITQNIDGLHRDAGTQHLIELHGNLRELNCAHCGQIFDHSLAMEHRLPQCPECREILHPGITLEGQEVRHFSLAVDWAGRAEFLLVIGTEMEMEPVRSLPRIAASHGAEILWINDAADFVVPRLFNPGIKGEPI